MSAFWKTVLAVGVPVIVVICVFFFMRMGYSNAEKDARLAYSAQLDVNNASFDKTWKIIQQQAGVADHERDSFKETYTEIMSATQGVAGNGRLASFFTQAKVDVSPDLFGKLMTSIEAQRESFFRDQKKLAELHKNHEVCLVTEPSSWFVGGREHIELTIVTSGTTKEAFSTGEENDVDLFDKGE